MRRLTLLWLFIAEMCFLDVNPSVCSIVRDRRKRSIFNLAAEVNAVAPRNALTYIDYGNYCGPGGNGVALDGVDLCCEVHDHCYGERDRNECKEYYRNLLFINYSWDLVNGQIHCEKEAESCPRAICECDKALAECFATNDGSFSSQRKRWFG
uniref:Phospholipase A2 n=1 Tax=Hemiscolopendra marginata TaxID=943146 RepID=A0A646QGN4_9MYRI